MCLRRVEVLCRGHAGGFLSGLLLAYLFGPRMVQKPGKEGRKPGIKGLDNKPRLPWFSADQLFTKQSQA